MISRKQFAEENRRMKELRRNGATEQFIKSWLRGWRMLGEMK